MNVKEFMKTYYAVSRYPSYGFRPTIRVMRPRIECNDGFTVSVQASEYHYCYPRDNAIQQGYTDVELGFPSEADELIDAYAEEPGEPTKTVYGCVPIDIVEKLVEKHGGIKGPEKEHADRIKEAGDKFTTCSW